ncbi:MAG: restriction endonuclease subunit M [Desulfobacteraceae bacterium IS3]|nr:MAG: restriction endonuclease subunit M [Desulfobacteraceae bacterium IS3]
MSFPEKIKKLIETFDYNLDSYKKGTYNETQVRREFIDPFFEELGWDITNKQGYAEAYKDVIHEDAIKIGGVTKAPDYCFRIGGARKFFLEAKKPAVNIKEDIHPAYQLRRYGWSAKLPLSILTDFEEFAVYDCRVKPAKTDKASHSRILYMRYSDYSERWEEIANIFSREAILKGSFDKYAESQKAKRGTTEVDAAFLQEIERWRELLARDIALRNPNLSQRELNFAVQQTVDRIVFLRICEDRGIEKYGRLAALQKHGDVYKQLFKLFRKADDKYNSGLFHFKKEKGRESFDRLTPELSIDDAVLKDIFRNLYYPDSPYEFSVLPADILGQVYEKFLGKVIRLTPEHHAVIEDKPEVRKAGGVYYTPTYIVNYIVKETVGKLLESKKPGAKGGVSHLRILDPACGSGSFLIGAYQFLLDWHLEQYVKDHPEKLAKGKKPVLYHSLSNQGDKGGWRLTGDERKRILLSHIYGVDIDSQAVEVTKLSLLLKVLEGEDEQSIEKQLALFQERALPDLANNIKCGNSLIGPDFYANQQMTLDEEEIYRVNAFDWNAEFPEIMKNGGFDAVIGNPPYFNLNTVDKSIFNYIAWKYPIIHTGYNDIMYYLMYVGIELLNKNGVLGMITSNYYLGNSYAELLRKYLKKYIVKLLNFENHKVFKDASIHTSIIFASKKPSTDEVIFFNVKEILNRTTHLDIEDNLQRISIIREALSEDWLIADITNTHLLHKLNKVSTLLGDIAIIEKGSTSGKNDVFSITYEFANKNSFEKELLRKNIKNSDIQRFIYRERNQYLIYVDNNTRIQNFPNILNYLSTHKQELLQRNEVKLGLYDWYRLERPRRKELFDSSEKLIVPYRAEKNRFAYDNQQFFNDGGDIRAIVLNADISISIKYLLGLLNSTLLNWQYGFIGKPKGKSREYFNKPMAKIPIRTIDFSNSADKSLHDRMVSLVDNMLDLHKKLAQAHLPQEKTVLARQIETTDRQIDRLVYQLYDLTEDEIKIVETGT